MFTPKLSPDIQSVSDSFFYYYFSAGSVVLYTGQGKFHSTTTDTVGFVVNKSETTVDNLRNVSDYLAAAKRIRVNQFILPPSIQNSIDSVEIKINSSAVTLEHETKKNSKDIQNVLDVVYVFIDFLQFHKAIKVFMCY